MSFYLKIKPNKGFQSRDKFSWLFVSCLTYFSQLQFVRLNDVKAQGTAWGKLNNIILTLHLRHMPNAEACDKWQYASLNYGNQLISLKRMTHLVDVNTVVIGHLSKRTLCMCKTTKPISANTEKELAVYFGCWILFIPICIIKCTGY